MILLTDSEVLDKTAHMPEDTFSHAGPNYDVWRRFYSAGL